MKPLNEHCLEMLRLIASCSVDGRYWVPKDKTEYYTDNRGCHDVFVHGAATTGAIRTLTARGLVEVIPGALNNKWSRRATVKGFGALLNSDTLSPFRYRSNS
jgi:hypothetical protein